MYDRANSHRDIPLYQELTTVEVEQAIARRYPVIVSLGATEQHGGHLPLGTDTYQALDMARRAAYSLWQQGIGLVVGPAIDFGPRQFLCEAPRDYPGTINVSNHTLYLLTKEVCAELIRHGFRKVYILIGNAESDAAGQIVAKELNDETAASVITLSWMVGITEVYKTALRSGKPQGHGGEGETARMLATAPHLVRMERAKNYHHKPFASTLPGDRLPYLGGGIGRYKAPEDAFGDDFGGIVGDPEDATAETGELLYKAINDWFTKVIAFEWQSDRR